MDERVKRLCAKAATACDSEVEQILAELQDALKEHARFVRFMASRTLNRMNNKELHAPQSKDAA